MDLFEGEIKDHRASKKEAAFLERSRGSGDARRNWFSPLGWVPKKGDCKDSSQIDIRAGNKRKKASIGTFLIWVLLLYGIFVGELFHNKIWRKSSSFFSIPAGFLFLKKPQFWVKLFNVEHFCRAAAAGRGAFLPCFFCRRVEKGRERSGPPFNYRRGKIRGSGRE